MEELWNNFRKTWFCSGSYEFEDWDSLNGDEKAQFYKFVNKVVDFDKSKSND